MTLTWSLSPAGNRMLSGGCSLAVKKLKEDKANPIVCFHFRS